MGELLPPPSAPSAPLQVVAGLIWRGGRLLVAQRLADARCANLWEFPGGKQEPGESPEQALAREVREEVGLTVEVGPLAWQVDHAEANLRLALRFYHVRPLHRDRARPLCSQRVAWLRPAQLVKLAFCPADTPLLRRLAGAEILPWPQPVTAKACPKIS